MMMNKQSISNIYKTINYSHPLRLTTIGYENSSSSKMRNEYRKLWQICRPQKKKYYFNCMLTLVHSSVFMYLPTIYSDISYLMSINLSNSSSSEIINWYLILGCKWSAIFAILGLITYKRRYQFLDIGNRISVRLRLMAYQQILSSNFYRRNQLAQTYVHHMVTDIKTVSDFTGEMIFMGIRGCFILVGGTVCLIYTSPYLSLMAVAIMSVFNLLFRGRNIKLKKLKQNENLSLISISEYISERFQNIRLIKISNTEAFEQLQFYKQINKFYEYSKKVAKANGLNYGSLEGIGLFSLFAVALSGSLLLSLQITQFSLIASSTYALYIALGFRSVMNFNTELMKIMGVYSNIEDKIGPIHKTQLYSSPQLLHNWADVEKRLKQLENDKVVQESKGLGIEIKDLMFNYEGRQLYNKFSLQIQPGSCVALIGSSGTGKSTLFNILTKLVLPQGGQIKIDQTDIHQLTFKDIHHMISYVTQQNYLFRGTVAENIKYGNHGFDCSQQNIWRCLQLTNAASFIRNKGGLNGIIEDKGSNLSGGEKQRLILSRALLKHPRLLLLDEATSGIDMESEQIIVNNLNNIRKQMTTIIITHKLQSFEPIITQSVKIGQLN